MGATVQQQTPAVAVFPLRVITGATVRRRLRRAAAVVVLQPLVRLERLGQLAVQEEQAQRHLLLERPSLVQEAAVAVHPAAQEEAAAPVVGALELITTALEQPEPSTLAAVAVVVVMQVNRVE